jgi:fermentation-respiration switch protein FrsA (DUF1100 family)
MMPIVRILVAVAFAYLVIVAVMYLRQRDLQYYPENKGLTPSSIGLSGIEVVELVTPDDETVLAWYSPAEAGRPTILYLHGNAGEIGDRADRFAAYQSQGFGVFFLSYRGYGGSTGSPSEKGLVTDGFAAYDWLTARGIEGRDIMLVGESLGTGIAVQLAAGRPVGAVALEAPFASAADIGAKVYWWLPVRLLMKDKFDSLDHVAKINAPLLVIHGEHDDLIPLSEGERLFAMAKEPKEMVIVDGGSHGSIFGEETWAREAAFFDRVRAR